MDAKFAVNYLRELSTDVRAAVMLDAAGELEAATVERIPRRLPATVTRLFERGGRAAGDQRGTPDQVEVATPDGEVFCVRSGGHTLVAITGRFALASLIFYDMLTVLRRLESGVSESEVGQ